MAVAEGVQKKESGFQYANYLTRLIVVIIVDGAIGWFGFRQLLLSNYTLVVALAIIALFVAFVFLYDRAYPLRWMAPGLVLMLLFSVYPNLMTIYVGFTNFGDGHLLSKEQAIEQIEKKLYLPEGGSAFTWTAFKSEAGDYVLWLQGSEGDNILAIPGQALVYENFDEYGVGELDDNGIPSEIRGYSRLNAIQAATDETVTEIRFGTAEEAVQIRSPKEAAQLQPQYAYDSEQDTFTDQATGWVYSQVDGTYMTVDGKELIPGYQAFIGFDNFKDFIVSPALRGPLVRIVLWNFAFPLLSVFLQFSMGLAIALLYGDPKFPGKKVVRSLLLIPYTIPSLITILIWRGMLNPEVGVINRLMETSLNLNPEWFSDPWLAKLAVIIVNLWLGYPYYMLVCSGALQSIPSELYEAAKVDGTNIWQRFRSITLPLLLVSVGPLLLASYVYNFNNFNLIYLFLQGGPPIPGASTRAGHTDIMISYVYNLAFEGGRGQNFGLAAAVTLLIFIIVIIITLFQFRYTRMWEEVSENV
jgi:ABC-type sugar transport system permease subunit